MDVITLLTSEQLGTLQKHFNRYPDGLTKSQFVDAMWALLKGISSKSRHELTIRLTEIFSQVDVNGDGGMDWDEFSAFCIESGMRIQQHEKLMLKYAQLHPFVDRTNHGGRVDRIHYYASTNQLITCEGGRNTVKLYEPFSDGNHGVGLKLVHGFSVDTQEEDLNATERPSTIDVVLLLELNVMVASTSDMILSFWDIANYCPTTATHRTSSRHSAGTPLLTSVHCPRTQYRLCWYGPTSTLYSSGTSGVIHAWHIEVGLGVFTATKVAELRRHTDMVTDMVVVEAYGILVTGGLDKKIHLWDAIKNKHKGSRVGHKMGVRSLSYAGEGCILSAGFEFDIYAWDISGMSFEPHFVLGRGFEGHTAPVMAVIADVANKKAFSVDDMGNTRWWDVRLDSSIVDSERSLQAVAADPAATRNMPFRPRAVCLVPGKWGDGESSMLLMGDARLHAFVPLVVEPAVLVPTEVLYNKTLMAFMATIGHDVKIWNAIDGSLICDLKGVAHSAASVCFDTRQRKYFLGSRQGDVSVYEASSALEMKRGDRRHTGEVSAMIFCGKHNMLITASWDRSICIFEDWEVDKLERLRCVKHAHSADITTAAYAPELSLIATGATDGTIHLWSFHSLHLDEQRIPPLGAEVTSLIFIEPYPLLLAGDASGRIWFWALRHHPKSGECLGLFQLKGRGRNASKPAAVTNMAVSYEASGGAEVVPGVRAGIHLLVISDATGQMHVANLTPTLRDMNMRAVPAEKSSSQFVRLKIERDMQDFFEDSRNRLPPQPPQKTRQIKIHMLESWRAHNDAIINMHITQDPKSVLTSSHDCKMRLWSIGRAASLCGQMYGEIDLLTNEVKKPWTFPVDHKRRRADENAEADNLIETLNNQPADEGAERLLALAKADDFGQDRGSVLCSRARASLMRSRSVQDISALTMRKNQKPEDTRARVQLQLVGEQSWAKTPMEHAFQQSLKRTAAKQQLQAELGRSQWDGIVSKASSATRRLIDLAELLEGKRLGQDASGITLPPVQLSRTAPQLPSHDENNWGISSLNRQKKMYPSMYHEMRRTKGTRGRRTRTVPRFAESKFMRQRMTGGRASTRFASSREVRAILKGHTGVAAKFERRRLRLLAAKAAGEVPVINTAPVIIDKDPYKWDVRAVCKVLEQRGFTKFVKYFRKAEVDGPALLNLKPIDMDEYGMDVIHAAEFTSSMDDIKRDMKAPVGPPSKVEAAPEQEEPEDPSTNGPASKPKRSTGPSV